MRIRDLQEKFSDTREVSENYEYSSNPARAKAFDQIAQAQRGEPEEYMVRLQAKLGGGLLQWMIEHMGDLLHRATEHDGRAALSTIPPKVETALRRLKNPYGFEREVEENFESNRKYRESKGEKYPSQEQIDIWLLTYARLHKQLPVYNELQWVCRECAIAVGNQNWSLLERLLEKLDGWLRDGTYQKRAEEFTGQPLRENFDDRYSDEDSDDPPYKAETMTLKAGMVLYHGTQSDEFDHDLHFPCWVSDEPQVAKQFTKWHSPNGKAKPRVMEYQLDQDLEVIVFHSSQAIEDFLEHRHVYEHYDNETLVDEVIAAGYAGWIIPDNYQPGADIMLARPCLIHRGTRKIK